MHSLNQTLSVWEDVLVQLRRTSVSWKGFSLSGRDGATFTEALVMCALHLTDLSTRHDGIGSQREIIAWTKSMVTLDVFELGSCLSDAITLLRSIESPTSLGWFKRQLSNDYPFIGMLLAPIRGALTDFLSAPNPRGFTVSYQFLSFLTHLSFLDLPVDQEDEYKETEAYLRSLQYDPNMLVSMNKIMREWLKDFRINSETFDPCHGPGSIAERFDKAVPLSKYKFLGTDTLMEYVFTKHADIDVHSFLPFPAARWDRVSKLVSVPKSMKTRRLISKEPATLMFFQQGVFRQIEDYVHNHKYLRRRINFRKQAFNANLAIRSSATGSFATIDLSSASDTVTVSLVKAVFAGTPLLPYLIALRSHSVELFSGEVMRVEKFAPMGSALCFPIETLIFACAVEHAVRHAPDICGHCPRYRVYGDDIIVQTPLFEEVSQVLGDLGFTLNRSKSFSTPSRFRESCGGEGFDGVNVTPMKISRRFYSVEDRITPHHAAIMEGLIGMANTSHLYGFHLLRAWIIRVLLGNSVAPPLFSGTVDCAIYSPWPDNFRAKSRYFVPGKSRTWYQRLEVEVVVSRSRRYTLSDANLRFRERGIFCVDALEQARYYETLRQSRFRDDDMFSPDHRISVPYGTHPTRLVKKWVVKPTLVV